jgi:hypothetical protein
MKSLIEAAEKLIIGENHSDQGHTDFDEEGNFLFQSLKKFLGEKGARDALDYGFYEFKGRYWMMRGSDTFVPVSNFVIKAKYLIIGAHPKRIVEIRNVKGKASVLDLNIDDLIGLDKFKFRVESVGNFLFDGKPADLMRIKNHLFNEERACSEITRLGWQKGGFFSFANGIYDGQNFIDIDDNGMVELSGEHYYIPVYGSTQAHDDEDLRNYRRFAHTKNGMNFNTWSKLFFEVYGENAMFGIAFYFFAIFSDFIFDRTKGAPMLFLYGQRGSGKGTMANSLLALFGTPQDPIMLGGASTVVGFMRKLGQFNNALVWLDEYKNDIGEKKIESLKNIWDRVGYERGVKDNSNRTQSTPVTSSAIVSGQEIPNVEPALFSRMVLLEFRAMQRDQTEVDNFNMLRIMEGNGLTNITLETLTHREHVKETFLKYYHEIAAALRQAFPNEIDRQINNYATLIAITRAMNEKIKLPYDWVALMHASEKYIRRQSQMMATSNEVQQFWEMVGFLLSSKLIQNGVDLHLKNDYVYIRLVTIVPLYRDYSRRQGNRALDKGTLVNYLQNSPAYVENESKTSSHRFPLLQNPTNAMVFLQADLKKLYSVDLSEIIQSPENQEDKANPTLL